LTRITPAASGFLATGQVEQSAAKVNGLLNKLVIVA